MESLCRFTLQEFIARAQDGSRLAGLLETRLVAAGCPVTEGEYRSWQNSLSALAGLLSGTSLDPGIQVGLEVRMPLSGRRADMSASWPAGTRSCRRGPCPCMERSGSTIWTGNRENCPLRSPVRDLFPSFLRVMAGH